MNGLDYLGVNLSDVGKIAKSVADVALPVASAVVPGLSVLTSKGGDQAAAGRDPMQQMMMMQMQQQREREAAEAARREREAAETRKMFMYAGIGILGIGGLYFALRK